MAPTDTPTRWWLFFFILPTVLLSCFFVYKTLVIPPVSAEPQPLKSEWYTLTTARGNDLENKPMVGNCFLCHAYWVTIPKSNQTSKPRFAHGNIVLNHGKNDRCYNCHLISDRNKYVADDGSAIMVQLPEKLCSRCHGLIYNDWLMGAHGKWTGMRQPENKSDKTTYTCTQCHDPHNPAFRYKVMAPPPVWPEKYMRTRVEESHAGPFSNFKVDDPPKEIF